MLARLPGVGRAFKQQLRDYPRLLNVGCALIAEAEGQVRPLGRSAFISYSITKNDTAHLRKGLKILAELMFAAGAEEVLPGVHGLPARIRPSELRLFDEAPLKPQCYTMVMTHLFGTARMSEDPRHGVVGYDFQLHDCRRVYVLDSSFFPTNLGVNPQHTIMAFATAAARRIAGG
jgi:choline dehydrogenase-like flavoprotein